jgi:hypothetical protein
MDFIGNRERYLGARNNRLLGFLASWLAGLQFFAGHLISPTVLLGRQKRDYLAFWFIGFLVENV